MLSSSYYSHQYYQLYNIFLYFLSIVNIMSIIYAAIAREDILLTQYTNRSGNFVLMANQVFKYCSPTKKYARFQIQAYVFYTVYVTNCIYLCMCEMQYEQRIAFLFLEDIRKLFESTFSDKIIQNSKFYGLNNFSKILSEKIILYNSPQNVDKIFKLKKTVEEITQISRENLDKVIARGEKIQVLVQKTKTMAALSLDLKSNSKTLKNQMIWKNLKWYFIIALVVILVIYFIMVASCGGFTMKKCF